MQVQEKIVLSPWGQVWVQASPKGIMQISLGSSRKIKEKPTKGLLFRVEKTLLSYFKGKRVKWDFPLDLSAGSEFDRKVWEAIRRIPYGETRTYKWVAEQIGHPKAVRAVGGALGRNPIPIIIPCHRVVRSDGGLGGFSGGLEWKMNLLALEGVQL